MSDKLKTMRELEKDCHWHYDTITALRQAAREWVEDYCKGVARPEQITNEEEKKRFLQEWIEHFFNFETEDKE